MKVANVVVGDLDVVAAGCIAAHRHAPVGPFGEQVVVH
jgi:hypothetical protein